MMIISKEHRHKAIYANFGVTKGSEVTPMIMRVSTLAGLAEDTQSTHVKSC